MTLLPDYQQYVSLKAAPPKPISIDHHDLVHSALGLASEYLELVLSHDRHNSEEELGDLSWYLMLIANTVQYPLDDLPISVPPKDRPTLTIRTLGEMVETFVSLVKKHVIYGNDQLDLLHKSFHGLWMAFLYHLQACNYPLDLCIRDNQRKLNERYASSFTPEEAAERKDKA